MVERGPQETSVLPRQSDFEWLRQDTIRLSDLDFQKHVNNAVITTLLADARFEFMHSNVRKVLVPEAKVFVVRLEVDFTAELHFGAPVWIGSRVVGVGRTSMRVEQAIFQQERCAAHALSVFVHIGEEGKPAPWPEAVRQFVKS